MSEKKEGYRDTLNLPKTKFSMKANLVQREPQQRNSWSKADIYGKIRERRDGSQSYILHDGPPYANGDIHMGHVINKVLKDFVVKYKTMCGYDAPYVPGWDCHGLPIESKVVSELGNKIRQMSKLDIRRKCAKYARKYLKLQSKQFQELGVFGDFENPYLTFEPGYEAGILEVFAELVDKGLVHKQLKPIHWSVGCETALAEAELEYKDITSPSIFVNFSVTEEGIEKLAGKGVLAEEAAKDSKVGFMIWTTTPWTLAANLAVAVHPGLEYKAISYEQNGRRVVSIAAAERLEAVIEAGNLEEGKYTVSEKSVTGAELEGLRYKHPFVKEKPTDEDAYMVICATYVTTEDGTGLVHIAPGHGIEDYVSGQQNGLGIYSPVNDDGCYDDTVPAWLKGKNVLEVDSEINAHLQEMGALFAEENVVHSYPHCWRSKTPVIFRTTEQWFIRVDKEMAETGKSLRDSALDSVKDIKWIPEWGQKRITGMLESRPDWCISRQRSWGLPIPIFVNSKGQALLSKSSVLAVAEHIAKKGSDSWFTDTPEEILGADFELPAGFSFDDLEREENIFDVWFESGCSWYNTAHKKGWPVPVDLYLEGSDQHRGWFQLSLLPALGSIGKAPYKSVLTHGFTVDENGMKQSKSLGNYVNAQDEISKYGADILRLWVSSVNYQEDMRCNDELIGKTQDAYRKIRNTIRYLLGNLKDFNPKEDAVDYEQMLDIDKWALYRLGKMTSGVLESYEKFAFHRVFSLIYNFCTVEMSNVYMDVLKDRLYCDGQDSTSRRSGQTVMYKILDSLVRLMAPILAHTAEEVWFRMEYKSEDVKSVHLAKMPEVDESIDYQQSGEKWEKIMGIRDKVLVVLEGLRENKKIASNQEASVTIYSDDEEITALLNDFGLEDFGALCIVSELKLQKGAEETTIVAEKSEHQKCQRCWNYQQTVGESSEHPDLCRRCTELIEQLQE